MPLHANGAARIDTAYCWDGQYHAHLPIGDFLHPGDVERTKNVQLFIEIRVVPDPKYKRKQRAWLRHKEKYHPEIRTRRYGWKIRRRNNVRCILDDEQGREQIRTDRNMKPLPQGR